jgi:Undecaprenyl-phosphate galactose phosphotransferase WbaP
MSAAASKKAITPTGTVIAPPSFQRAGRHEDVHVRPQSIHAGRLGALEYLARAAADVAALCVAVLLAGATSWIISKQILNADYYAFSAANLQHRLGLWAILFLGLCSWFSATGAYSARNPLHDDVKQVISALTVMLVIDGFVQFASKEEFSRLWIVLVWPIAAVLIPVCRIVVRRLLNAWGAWRMGAVVIGGGSHFASVAQSLEDDLYVGYSIACHLRLSRVAERPLSQIATDLAVDMRLRGAETVILVPSPAEMSEMDRVIDALNLNRTAYTLIPPLQRLPFAGLKVQTMLNSDAIMMTSRTGLMSPMRQGIKRLFDVVVSLLLIALLLPVLLVITSIVAWGGGPVLYGHKRVGKDNRPFHCLKFRTMAVNSDKILANLIATNPEIAREWRQNFKLENDPRITPIGRFLRKTSLDELPQLINVIRGEMSLVGPRPVVADELRYYYGENAGYYHMVRPGITGLWQVSGRSQTTYDRRVFLDTCYVRNWNLWTDVAILFNTVPSVLGGDGAC